MPTNFPGSLDTFTTKVPHVSANAAADVNNLQDAVAAIEATLKTTPNPNPLDFVSKTQPDTITGDKVLTGNTVAKALTAATSPYAPWAQPGTIGNIWFLPAPKGGALDDSANAQQVIDACNAAGGGEVYGWGNYIGNVVVKEGVRLRGPDVLVYVYGTSHPFQITAFGAGWVVDTPVGAIGACAITGVMLRGLGAATSVGGIRFQNVTNGHIDKVAVVNVADEAVAVRSPCSACTLDDLFLAGLANLTRGALIGCLDVDGPDHWLGRGQVTLYASTGVTSVNLYCCAVLLRGSAYSVGALVGEFADVGIYVLGSGHRLVLTDADHNWGHGVVNAGSRNIFVAVVAGSNSQDTTNTYDNFRATPNSARGEYTSCQSNNLLAKVAKYGFNDLVTTGNVGNHYVNCLSAGAGTQDYIAQAVDGSSFSWASTSYQQLALNSATPSVSGLTLAYTVNSSPTTITDFTKAVPGQRLVLNCLDDLTTIQSNGATIALIGGFDKKLISGQLYEFVRLGGAWQEIGSASFDTLSTDNGDAAKTLVPKRDQAIQQWATPLTATRAVTLSSPHWYSGGWGTFRIVRKASATGAFTLDVGAGPLKSLAAGQWCQVAQDGSGGWLLVGFGSL